MATTNPVQAALAKELADLAAAGADLTALQAAIAALPPPAPALAVSPSGAYIDNIGPILVDKFGNVWQIVAGNRGNDNPAQMLALNGTTVPSGAVILGLIFDGIFYQENNDAQQTPVNKWWSAPAANGAFVAVPGDPRAAPAPPIAVPPASTVPAAAAAVGYNICVLDIEEWTTADLDMGAGTNGFPMYCDGSWVAEQTPPTKGISIVNGQLELIVAGIVSGSQFGLYGNPQPSTGNATYNPNSNWVGTAWGPGSYIGCVMQFDPANMTNEDWNALWGTTFYRAFNNNTFTPTGPNATEDDYAEMLPGMVAGTGGFPSFNAGIISWGPKGNQGQEGTGMNFGTAPDLNKPPFSNGNWNFNEPHLYERVHVTSADNGGAGGYTATYVDGNLFFKNEYAADGIYAQLDKDPFIFMAGGPQMTLGRMRVYVKDMTRVVATFPVTPLT